MRPSSLLKVCPQTPQREPNASHSKYIKLSGYTVFAVSYLPLLSPNPCICNEIYLPVDNFCIYNFGTEFSMQTKWVQNFPWFLMSLFTETEDKIIVTQCWDHFMFLQHQLSNGGGVQWRILTSLPPCPRESLSDLHQTQREPKEPILITQHMNSVIVSYSKPHKHTLNKGKNRTGSTNWKATINSDP